MDNSQTDMERRLMPNGRRSFDYNPEWCKDKHEALDKRMDKLDSRMWSILIMLFVNFGGIIGVLLTVLWSADGGA